MIELLLVAGFTVAAERNRIVNEVFPNFDTISTYETKDIRDIVRDYGSRTQNDGRMIIPRIRVNNVLGLTRWVKDAYRAADAPDPAAFNAAAIITANRRHDIREAQRDQSETVAKSAEPKKLKGEKDWYEWYASLLNYLSLLLGSNDVPLVYVLREVAIPVEGAEYSTYEERVIARAPLSGDFFDADKQRVHHIVKSYTQGQSAEEWIRGLAHQKNGRADCASLKRHFQGEGNSSRRIAEAESLRDSLFYKSERGLAFHTFLDKLQLMFTIYRDEAEELSEEAKVRIFLKKITHRDLVSAVNAVRMAQQTAGVASFTRAADFIAGEVSRLPEAQSFNRRNLSEYNTGGRGGGGRGGGRGGRGGGRGGRGRGGRGQVHYTGKARWRDDFHTLPKEQKDAITAARRVQNKEQRQGDKTITMAQVQRMIAKAATQREEAKDAGGDDNPADDAGGAAGAAAEGAGGAFGGRREARERRG